MSDAIEFKAFIDEVVNELPDYLLRYDIDKIQVEDVCKNNGVVYTGIIISVKNENMSPNVYMNYYYELYKNGKSIEDITKDIVREYEKAREEMLAEGIIAPNKDDYAKKVFLRLVNYEKNKEQLKDCPFIIYHDLAITIRYLVKQDKDGIASALITNRELKEWGISKEEIYCIAKENTLKLFPPVLKRLDIMLKEMNCAENVIDGTKLYILTNKAGVNGATSMIYEDIIKAFAVEHSTDVYILPSSIHEVLLLPHEEGMDKNEIEEMVREINTYVVSKMEYLSDNVYKYDFKELCVKI